MKKAWQLGRCVAGIVVIAVAVYLLAVFSYESAWQTIRYWGVCLLLAVCGGILAWDGWRRFRSLV